MVVCFGAIARCRGRRQVLMHYKLHLQEWTKLPACYCHYLSIRRYRDAIFVLVLTKRHKLGTLWSDGMNWGPVFSRVRPSWKHCQNIATKNPQDDCRRPVLPKGYCTHRDWGLKDKNQLHNISSGWNPGTSAAMSCRTVDACTRLAHSICEYSSILSFPLSARHLHLRYFRLIISVSYGEAFNYSFPTILICEKYILLQRTTTWFGHWYTSQVFEQTGLEMTGICQIARPRLVVCEEPRSALVCVGHAITRHLMLFMNLHVHDALLSFYLCSWSNTLKRKHNSIVLLGLSECWMKGHILPTEWLLKSLRERFVADKVS